MKPERWKQVSDLFQSAIERAPRSGPPFLMNLATVTKVCAAK